MREGSICEKLRCSGALPSLDSYLQEARKRAHEEREGLHDSAVYAALAAEASNFFSPPRVVVYDPVAAGDTLKALAEGFDFCEFFKAAGVDTSTAIDCPNILAVAPIPDNGRAFGGWGA